MPIHMTMCGNRRGKGGLLPPEAVLRRDTGRTGGQDLSPNRDKEEETEGPLS